MQAIYSKPELRMVNITEVWLCAIVMIQGQGKINVDPTWIQHGASHLGI